MELCHLCISHICFLHILVCFFIIASRASSRQSIEPTTHHAPPRHHAISPLENPERPHRPRAHPNAAPSPAPADRRAFPGLLHAIALPPLPELRVIHNRQRERGEQLRDRRRGRAGRARHDRCRDAGQAGRVGRSRLRLSMGISGWYNNRI